MAVFTVTTAVDVVNEGDGVLSLREAVQQANATAASDTILFAGALEGQTLTLTRGQLDLTGDLAIDGDRNNDGSEVTISGGDASRVLAISGSDTDVGLNELTIADGNTIDSRIGNAGGAGILANAGVGLTLSGCTLQGNDAYYGAGSGGALFAAAGRARSRSSAASSAGTEPMTAAASSSRAPTSRSTRPSSVRTAHSTRPRAAMTVQVAASPLRPASRPSPARPSPPTRAGSWAAASGSATVPSAWSTARSRATPPARSTAAAVGSTPRATSRWRT